MSNALQFLDLRQVYTRWLRLPCHQVRRTILDFLGGVNYTHETYSNGTTAIPGTSPSCLHLLRQNQPLRRSDPGRGTESQARQEHRHYPESLFLSRPAGHERVSRNVQSSARSPKSASGFGWQNQFGDIYVTNPPTGAKKNDVLFTTGLNISFTH